MPFGLMEAGVAADIGGGVLAPLFGHLTNVRNRKFTREMYQRQREDALADWQRQNEYNSPRAQMQRFQEAGLNPALIYGQTNMAAPVRSSSASGGSADAPRPGSVGESLFTYQQIKHSQAQVDLLAKQMGIAEEEKLLKRALTFSTLVGAGKTDVEARKLMLELGIESELRTTTIEGRKAGVDKLKTEIGKIETEVSIALQRNLREEAMNNATVREIIARIRNLGVVNEKLKADILKTKAETEKVGVEIGKTAAETNYILGQSDKLIYDTRKVQREVDKLFEEIRGTKLENTLKSYEIQLESRGIHKGTPAWYRAILIELEKLGQWIKD